ncbi:S8 family serine peptidase [Hymenobacter sp. BT188]|uniref:S8 family peptidase n=1 Tax=Hymenobacter sp. BT188 TaxID=2763504 RepID=UPI00165191E1|nr:S8 family peptidase [Hymenobacter sp. BT188]MBC6606157.1 S8 family serine peptidase [Hymenobacter sp. BT188]
MKHKHMAVFSKPLLVGGLLSAVFLAGCESSLDKIQDEPTTQSQLADAQGEPGRDYVANELLVKFKAGVSEEAKANALARISGKVSEKILTKAMERAGEKEGLMVVHTPLQALEAMSKMKGGPEIEYAEPNYIYQHTATSNDTYYTNNSLWGMYGDATSPANQFGSQAGEAWAANHTGSNTVYVGIIDEGFQNTHPELDANEWDNPYDPVDGVDNDKNGYIDDTDGWDFDSNDNTIYDGGTRGSLDDHGTHVAGTIGAERNGTGVVGVNWSVTMISGKFLGRRGGTTANAIKAVDYFTDLKTRHGLNIVATNNSWGGGGSSSALLDAIKRANAANILFIAAAGNGGSDGVGDNNDAVASFPSNYDVPNVIAVAAITSTGAKSSFSNYGATTVDLGAPGSGINSTTAFNTYSSYSGTSMATPHVTGAAALYAAAKPGSSAAQIKNALLSSAVPTTSLAGRTVTGGRLDANGALSK